MNPLPPLSVRRKLVWLILLTSALALCCVVAAAVIYEIGTFQPRALAELQGEADVLEEVLAAALDFELKESAEKGLARHGAERGLTLAALYDTRALFAAYRREGADAQPPSAPQAAAHEFRARTLSLWRPVRNHDHVLIGHLFLEQPLPPLHARLPQYAIMTGTVLLALTVVGGLMMGGLNRNVLRPLAALVATTKRVSEHNDYSIRATVRRQDELGQLAVAFNQMLEVIGQRELALRESEARFRHLFEHSRAVLLLIAPDTGAIVEANPAAADFYGYPLEVLRGMTAQDLSPRPANEVVAARLDALEGRRDQFIVPHRRASGEVRTVELRASPVEVAGRQLLFSIVHDITERVRAEAERNRLQGELLQAQKMESVGRLAGGVAHDFNNMLQAILGNAALALQDLPPDSPVRESLEEIQKSGQRSADLTRQLLAFARKQTIAPKVLDLNDTVAGMLRMLRRLIGEDLHLSWMPGANLWPVKLDPSQIDQVLANLCVNARDAITGTGTVSIQTANVVMDDTYVRKHPDCVPGDYVLLAVSDTGKGMDAETRSHLFEPFFTTKEMGKGTGLGLATVFGIVKQNAGLISVYSEPGQGTTFKIYLPRAEDHAVATVAVTSQPALRGTETVLLVEDEEQILVLARRTLQRLGYTVLAATSPEQALRLAAQHSGTIHLLITDVVMPGMNGRELRGRLEALQPELRCLYMSGYTANVIAHHGVLDEGVQFLQKPFTIESLAGRVRDALQPPSAS